MKIGASGPGLLELYPFVIFHYFLLKISLEILYLQTSTFVHMTSMTSCIVENKIRAIGPGPLELFPFIVLAIKVCIFLNNFYTCF